MNFIKRNLKVIIAFIIGSILATGITVFATINANSVDYTNNQKVSDALNDLYSKSTELTTLKSDLAQTDATADKILQGYKAYSNGQLRTGTYTPPTTTKGVEWNEGSFTHQVGTNTITTGFEPSFVSLWMRRDNGYICLITLKPDVETSWMDRQANETFCYGSMSGQYTFTNTGFTIKGNSGDPDIGGTYHWVAYK